MGFTPIFSGVNSNFQVWSHSTRDFQILHHATSGIVINLNNFVSRHTEPQLAPILMELIDIIRDLIIMLPNSSVTLAQKIAFAVRLNRVLGREHLGLNQLPSGILT